MKISLGYPKRCFEEDELNNIFPYKIVVKQESNFTLSLLINMKKYERLYSNILEFPFEINNIIKEYLDLDLQYELFMYPSRDYPFKGHIWDLKNCNSNSKIIKCISDSVKYENHCHELDWSPAVTPLNGIISMISRIQFDLTKLLNINNSQ